MATLADMVAKGKRKYSAKIPGMVKSYKAAESRAKDHYDDTPFGPTRKSNYKDAWKYMPANYEAIVKPGLEAKWADNWEAIPLGHVSMGLIDERVNLFIQPVWLLTSSICD